MQTYSGSLGWWFRRLAGNNPLLRISDRIEAGAVALMAVLAIATIPFAAAAGTAVHDSFDHQFAAARLARQQVDAFAVAESRVAPQLHAMQHVTDIQWQFKGATHNETIRSDLLRKGDRLTIWVDESGARTIRPPSSTDAVVQAAGAAMLLWMAGLTPAMAAFLLLRDRLNRARARAWDSEFEGLSGDGGRTAPS